MFTDTQIAARADNKVAAEVGDDAVILDIESGSYFQINKIGSRIWAMLDEPMPVAALCAKLEATFDVDPAHCRADVSEFLEKMREKGLLRIS